MLSFERREHCTLIRLACGVTNVLTTEVVVAITEALDRAERDSATVLLCGGDNFFCNGVDLNWALAQSSGGMREMFLALGNCLMRIMESPLPIVSAIKGHATGAGMALVTACDYRYGAVGRVLIGKPKVLIGVPNPYYSDQLLRFVAGDFVASDLIYSGRLIACEETQELKILHGVAAKDRVEAMGMAQTEFLNNLPNAAFIESKNMRTGRFCTDMREQLSTRVARQVEIWNSEEAQTRLHEAAKRLSR